MRKRLVILGATGSIGENALSVLGNLNEHYELVGISAYGSHRRLLEISKQQNVKSICFVKDGIEEELDNGFLRDNGIKLFSGLDGLLRMLEETEPDLVLNGLVGSVGLQPTMKSIEVGADVALANKEALVVGGEIITKAAEKNGVKIIPVDSEHSAIMQCLEGETKSSVKRIILTASGGPFLNRDLDEFENITVDDALDHPNWSMGRKITIDSATMMNKGLEVIEAKWLFDMEPDRIDIIIHPQSIIHSMVEFVDGSVKAQLGIPDMKLPIQYALTYPERMNGIWNLLDFEKITGLTFTELDSEKYPCVGLAYAALDMGGTAPAVLNKANEVAVNKFLENEIGFQDISGMIEKTLEKHDVIEDPTLDDLLESEKWVERELRVKN